MTNMPPPYAYLHLDTATEKWTVHDEPGPMRVAVWTKNLIESAQPAPVDGLDFEPDEMHTVADMANVGYSLMQAIKRNCPDYAYNESPAEIVADLMNERDEARATRPAESVAQGGDSDWERQWREGWAYSYSGWKLYGDDGELQDNSVQPFIDWRKDSPGEIRSKIAQRSKRAREESEAATPTPAPATGSGGEESK